MMKLLEGKVAIVTGAGAGIGRGVARTFAREGATVILAEVNEQAGSKAAEEIRNDIGGTATFMQVDVSDEAACGSLVSAVMDRFGKIDILVNNANMLSKKVPLEQKTTAMLSRTLGIGLWGTWWLMQAVFPHMRDNGGGRIINFYSMDADMGAWLQADYCANKGAIQALTRSAAVEWGRHNIQVNAVAPAAAGTNFERYCREIPGYFEDISAQNPLGRVGDPEADIAPVLVFLASELARYVNGVTIPVDGGMHLPRYDSRPDDIR